ncbi:LOW QUALITY PROTEIN: Integrase, catalytic core protein [Phytophthora megakarya]|uniref:Integrase, catalytic core protein n=1 Tax=Phytophthora megakarya TaxID=4795 RepID=A0A225W7E0_9STRA|nr:LOW QUALITY PROTEIN: Integrase, catalytic core protein [Phytophthora megakarya]
MFLGNAENVKGYRVYDLDASKATVARSVQLDSVRTLTLQYVPPERVCSRRSREPVLLLLEHGSDGDEEQKLEHRDGPPSPNRARIDEDTLVAEAVLAYSASIVEGTDTYAQGMVSSEAAKWRDAMKAELLLHERNGTWTLVPREPDKRTIGLFAKKRDENGRVIRYKAHLVAKVFIRKFGVDVIETYTLVTNMNSIRVVLPLDVVNGYISNRWMPTQRFWTLKDLVDMEVPPFGIDHDGNHVCQLNKAIFRLKQAEWRGIRQSTKFWLREVFRNEYVYICLYVYDMIIVAKTSEEIREVKNILKTSFKMKELGAAKSIYIDHDEEVGTFVIKQTRYIHDVAERFGQRDVKRVDNPCTSNRTVAKEKLPRTDAERAEMRSKPYRSLIGYLSYITTCTRRDGIRVLRYLTTREFGIFYHRGSSGIRSEAYTDADWGSNIDYRRSVSGVLVVIGNAAVEFKSMFQRTVALSLPEAEYMVFEHLYARGGVGPRNANGYGARVANPSVEGQPRCLSLANNAGYHARTQHVDIHYHFIRENVEDETVKIGYIDTKHHLADIGTKASRQKEVKYHQNASGVKTKVTEQSRRVGMLSMHRSMYGSRSFRYGLVTVRLQVETVETVH